MRPIQNKIQDVLVDRLNTSGLLVQVVTPNLADNYTPMDGQVVLTPDSTERNEDIDCQGNPPATGWTLTFQIRVIARQEEEGHDSIDEKLSESLGSVYNSITSPSDWWTMGGNAINSEFSGIERSLEDMVLAAYQLTLLVHYRTDETNILNGR